MLVNRGTPSTESLALQIDEPRCRVCRDPSVRRHVNELLRFRGGLIPQGDGTSHRVTYKDVLRALEPINKNEAVENRITYDSLRTHKKRHFDIEGVIKYWCAKMDKDLSDLFGTKITVMSTPPHTTSTTNLGCERLPGERVKSSFAVVRPHCVPVAPTQRRYSQIISSRLLFAEIIGLIDLRDTH